MAKRLGGIALRTGFREKLQAVARCGRISRVKIKHKGLRLLAEHDDPARVPANLLPRLRRILLALAAANDPGSLKARPSLRLHPLKGDMQGYWSLNVSGNWRVIFRFEGGEAVGVDLVDYH